MLGGKMRLEAGDGFGPKLLVQNRIHVAPISSFGAADGFGEDHSEILRRGGRVPTDSEDSALVAPHQVWLGVLRVEFWYIRIILKANDVA